MRSTFTSLKNKAILGLEKLTDRVLIPKSETTISSDINQEKNLVTDKTQVLNKIESIENKIMGDYENRSLVEKESECTSAFQETQLKAAKNQTEECHIPQNQESITFYSEDKTNTDVLTESLEVAVDATLGQGL